MRLEAEVDFNLNECQCFTVHVQKTYNCLVNFWSHFWLIWVLSVIQKSTQNVLRSPSTKVYLFNCKTGCTILFLSVNRPPN